MNKNIQHENAVQNTSHTAVQSNARTTPPQKRRKKLRFKPNKEGMIALLALLLIVAAVITLLVFGIKGIVALVNKDPAESTSSSDNTPPPALPWNNAYVSVEHANSNIPVGDLVLVNFQNEYPLTNEINSNKYLTDLYGYEGHGSYYVLNSSNTKVRSSIIKSLQLMIQNLVDATPSLGTDASADRVIITSGYRDIAKQTDLYNNNTTVNLVAEPGHSEHHSGYAVDIQLFTSKGATTHLGSEAQEWMEAHCAEYGFVIRYDGAKQAITGIVDETWHYRYVGVPHATYMTEHNLCLEEYLELIRTSHTYEQTALEITAGEKTYLVYYVAATENATFTSIPVPPASEGTYTISGDNMNGFIVTVEKTAK